MGSSGLPTRKSLSYGGFPLRTSEGASAWTQSGDAFVQCALGVSRDFPGLDFGGDDGFELGDEIDGGVHSRDDCYSLHMLVRGLSLSLDQVAGRFSDSGADDLQGALQIIGVGPGGIGFVGVAQGQGRGEPLRGAGPDAVSGFGDIRGKGRAVLRLEEDKAVQQFVAAGQCHIGVVEGSVLLIDSWSEMAAAGQDKAKG